MQQRFFGLLVFVLAFVSTPLKAQTPAGATGVCNDGSNSTDLQSEVHVLGTRT